MKQHEAAGRKKGAMVSSSNTVKVTVRLSGWLASYFDQDTFVLETVPTLQDAIHEVLQQTTRQALSPIPEGGMHILVNGAQARTLIRQGYVLQSDDEIMLVPVVAGGSGPV